LKLSSGKLYIVATPIGNMEDISLRALRTLREVHLVAAEDTRITARLFACHDIRTPLLSFHEYNETQRTAALLEKLEAGESLALVSDAGTPSVSDPGYRLVLAALEKKIPVIPVPGVSAAVTALSVSGLPTDTFTFAGFPPRKKGKRLGLLESLKTENRTLIFYESPRRISSFLAEVQDVLGDRPAVLAREMTKLYEEFIRGSISRIREELESRQSVKGECTLLVGGSAQGEEISGEKLEEIIAEELNAGTPVSYISKKISKERGISRKEVYALALKMREDR
jgi:16S rRNA (cytidine1402-2'-O)-methyltransferase